MPNLKSAPGAIATQAKRHSPRRSRGRHAGHAWWEAIKVGFLLQRMRRRPQRKSSSPSVRQIALVVVSAGIVLVIVRVATHRGKSSAGDGATAPSSSSESSPSSESESESGSGSGSDREAPVPGNESPLTDTVQQEMFHRSDAVRPDA
ncbi:MAG TPA: hypothetical protein VMG37_06585 [Solirubrobacteraceae bacterium]|nr:hypothetical protein [Solirubrobacteraceae bacterium]